MSAIQAIGAVALLVPLLFLMPVRALVKWFAIWGLYDGYTPLADANAHTLGGHALTIYAAWKAMDHDVIPPAGEGIVGVRLLAAAVVGSAMGAFFRGAMQVLDMLMTNPTLKDFAIKLESDQWPHHAPPPPLDVDATRLAPWSASERGVAIRMCKEPGKGEGVFASRPIPRGTIVGVYVGEMLSQRAYALRHKKTRLAFGSIPVEGSAEHEDAIAKEKERAARLGALTRGVPIGGASNGGSYVWELLPSVVRYPEDRMAYIDGEDPNRSSWCRYINNAPTGTSECNLHARKNAHRALVWFEAKRDIAGGEELHFDYKTSWWKSRFGGLADAVLRQAGVRNEP